MHCTCARHPCQLRSDSQRVDESSEWSWLGWASALLRLEWLCIIGLLVCFRCSSGTSAVLAFSPSSISSFDALSTQGKHSTSMNLVRPDHSANRAVFVCRLGAALHKLSNGKLASTVLYCSLVVGGLAAQAFHIASVRLWRGTRSTNAGLNTLVTSVGPRFGGFSGTSF